MAKFRVIQWGAGFVGETALRFIAQSRDLELVGAKCFTAEKAGRDVGEFIGRETSGIAFSRDRDALLALEADCVIFMPRDLLDDPSIPGSSSAAWVDDLEAILRSGKNVISPICTATHWAHMQNGDAFKRRLDAACAAGGSSVLFSGFDPGFTTDALAFSLSSVVGSISQIRTWEIIDVSTYESTDVLRQLGFGARPEDLPPDGALAIFAGWGGALHLLADAFAVTIEDKKIEFDISIAAESFTTPGGLEIARGTIAGVRWSLAAVIDGAERFVINHVTRAGKGVAPDWPNIGTDGGYRVEIDGFPPLRSDFPMGLPGGTGSSFADAMAMTAARCVNSVRTIVEATPGYHTMLSLTPLGGRSLLAGASN